MRKRSLAAVLAVASVLILAAPAPVAADDYAIDAVHSGVTFKVSHLGLAWIYGRFDDFSGKLTLDSDPARCSFNLTIKADSMDTNNKQRDGHLRSPDFFNAKQFPAVTFQSTAVKAAKDGFEVAGDLTMHGETKPVSFTLVGGKTVRDPKGTQRTGFS